MVGDGRTAYGEAYYWHSNLECLNVGLSMHEKSLDAALIRSDSNYSNFTIHCFVSNCMIFDSCVYSLGDLGIYTLGLVWFGIIVLFGTGVVWDCCAVWDWCGL